MTTAASIALGFILGIIFILVVPAVFVLAFGNPNTKLVSRSELDQFACDQLRDEGWKEPEIKAFMSEHNGLYFPPES